MNINNEKESVQIIKYSFNQIICNLDVGFIQHFKYDLLKTKFIGFREYKNKISFSSPCFCLIITRNGLMKLHLKKPNLLININNIDKLINNILYNLQDCYISKPTVCNIKIENIQLTFNLNFSFTFYIFLTLLHLILNKYYNIFCRSDYSLECYWIKLLDNIDQEEILHATHFVKLKHKLSNAVFTITYSFFGSSIIKTSSDLTDFIQYMNSLAVQDEIII